MASQRSARGQQSQGRRTSKSIHQSQNINSEEIVYIHKHGQTEEHESESEEEYHEVETGDARDVVIQPEDVSDMSRSLWFCEAPLLAGQSCVNDIWHQLQAVGVVMGLNIVETHALTLQLLVE